MVEVWLWCWFTEIPRPTQYGRPLVGGVLRELGEHLPAAAGRPGLALLATEDHYVGTDEMRRVAAARAHARVAVLDGLGHWWMVQDPGRAAGMLDDFWS